MVFASVICKPCTCMESINIVNQLRKFVFLFLETKEIFFDVIFVWHLVK